MKQSFQLKPLVIALGFLGASLPIHVFAEETQKHRQILKVMSLPWQMWW